MKHFIFFVLLLCGSISFSQEKNETQKFWNTLKTHCDNSYKGKVIEAPENDDFRGKELIMHVRSCEENTIKIPFFVGEDKSRTWVLTLKNNRIQLKHDHRHEDGSEDDVTQYGGTTTNPGLENLQMFPADQETATLLPLAATNIWWITIEETTFSYNLRRHRSPIYDRI